MSDAPVKAPTKRGRKDYIEELNARLRFIIGVCLAFTLTGTIWSIVEKNKAK